MSEVITDNLEINYDLATVRGDFPILLQHINGKPLIYFDNAATSQKPSNVIAAMSRYYQFDNANIHRGVHTLSVRATDEYEHVRHVIAKWINAQHDHEIIFTKGTTDAINLIAQSFGRSELKAGDEIVLSEMEHHSNIVPWQLISDQMGAVIKVIPVTDVGELDIDAYRNLLSDKTKIVAITHVSNAIGTINPIETLIQLAHDKNIPVLIDGAQAIPHMGVDVQQLNCDFYVFSGHKMYGPTGTGVLYGKSSWLEKLPPYQGGGDMISEVSFQKTNYNKLPFKFEAGTPNIAGVIGLGAAIDYLRSIGFSAISSHENALLDYATSQLKNIEGIKIIGESAHKAAVISFLIDTIHPHDIGTVLDHEGIAIRAGHHCAMPLMTRFNIPATARISFGIYNSEQEIDAFVSAILKVKGLFS